MYIFCEYFIPVGVVWLFIFLIPLENKKLNFDDITFTIDFCILVFYPVILLVSFINSSKTF